MRTAPTMGVLCSMLIAILSSGSAHAQTTTPQTQNPTQPAKPENSAPSKGAPDSVAIFFDPGSSSLRSQDKVTLDKVSRLYSEGKPIVMMLAGSSDRTGDAQSNLLLSQRRATAVLKGLLDRGIPAERFQVIAKGETELPVPTAEGVREAKNRRVEITWR